MDAGAARAAAQQVLVVAQVPISFLVLAAAGLFVRTLDNLHSVGWDTPAKNILFFVECAPSRASQPETGTFGTRHDDRNAVLTTMQIPIRAGHEADDRDQPGSTPVAVFSERMARTYSRTKILWARASRSRKRNAHSRFSLVGEPSVRWHQESRVTYVLLTAGDPLSYVSSVHEIVREADRAYPSQTGSRNIPALS